jgi:hypothetical protein
VASEEETNPQFKIRLSSAAASASSDLNTQRNASITFDVTPELVENRNINYKSFDPVHAPGQIYVYQNTSARTFQLSNIKLISRTPEEASKNLARLWTMRGWTMPSFGTSSFQNGTKAFNEQISADDSGNVDVREMIRQMSGDTIQTNFLGAPPAVLYLSAFSRMGANNGTRSVGHLRNIPVVITQLSIPYPTDVDYIPTASSDGSGKDSTPMPTIMTIDMQLTETHSPNEYEKFNLQDYRLGNLRGF